jgi:hypothetical protein
MWRGKFHDEGKDFRNMDLPPQGLIPSMSLTKRHHISRIGRPMANDLGIWAIQLSPDSGLDRTS